MASPLSTSLLQKAERTLENVFHTAQDWSFLGPLWRDAGHIIGWKRLIKIYPGWIDFVPITKANLSDALLSGGGFNMIGDTMIPRQPDAEQVADANTA